MLDLLNLMLCGTNLYGYYKCSGDHSKKIKGLQSQGFNQIAKNLFWFPILKIFHKFIYNIFSICSIYIYHNTFFEFFLSKVSKSSSFDISGCLFANAVMYFNYCSLSAFIGLFGFYIPSPSFNIFPWFQFI